MTTTLFSRRTFGALSLGALAACQRAPKSGPPPDVEVTGVVDVPRAGLGLEEVSLDITGEGHTHPVRVSRAQLGALARGEPVVLLSGPANTDGHRHWLRARVV